ncbi:MAG TPA: tetratricopeptide repeat protein, partial [Anaeromyxobacteraceae bacterium]|nr:tetratricopeptide repeat protein [Anaeromyxobacteraceae bacterium]
NSSRLYREAYLLDPLVDPRILRYLGVDELVPRYGAVEFQGGIVLATAVPWWEGKTKRGVRYLVDGQYDSSFATLDQVLHAREMSQGAVLPDLFIWYYGLASAHAAKYDRAAAAFQELAQRAYRRQHADPDWVLPSDRADYLYLYAVMSSQYGNLGVALPAFQEALSVNLGLFEAHSRLADIQENRGDVDGAITERRRAVDVSPETGELHLDLGVTLLGAGQAAAAESAFVDAARLLPDDAGAQQFLANTALQVGDSAVARRALERFVVVAPARYAEQVAQARRTLAGLP